MGLYKELSNDLEVVDVIIVGGGTAGCIVASRLADADPKLSILVIENGQDNYGNITIMTPAMFPVHLAPDSKTMLWYKANPSKHVANRAIIVPSGSVLGGGSSVNFMMYTRGQRQDYDSWGTPGWSTEELGPVFKKLETYHGPKNDGYHGYEGPIQVSSGTMRLTKVEEAVYRAGAEVGYGKTEDLQDLDHGNAFGPSRRYVSPEGQRSDTAHMYLHPRLRDGKHPNLHVLVESQVIRILFDEEKRACGVEYRPNPLFQEDGAKLPPRTVRARKLVVASTGACGTPLLLERSGIGSADVLKKAGVPLVEELPGVGQNYQDHHSLFYPFQTSLEPHETLDELVSGQYSYEEAIKNKDPRLGWNTLDAAGKLRPSEEEVLALGPEFKAAWDKNFRDHPERPMMLMAVVNMAFVAPEVDRRKIGPCISVVCYTAYPYSRGHIHITGPALEDSPDFNAGFLSDAGDIDLKKLMWSYKKARELGRRLPMITGELAVGHPQFAADSPAACTRFDENRDISTLSNIEYTAEDDKVIEQFIREHIETTWHSVGTAKMAPREKLGVVDKDLNVYGVKGLKIADLSMAPKNVGANTNNTALLIGEKAAEIIIRDLGLGPAELA